MAITYTNIGSLSKGALGKKKTSVKLNKIAVIFILVNPFENVVLQWQPFCLDISVLFYTVAM